MNLEQRLRRALMAPLPGLDAQLRMAPQPRVGWDPEHPLPDLRDAAALVLIYPFNDSPHVLLTVRGAGLRKHTGQVALPGGSVDVDESIETAALREASEEVGLPPALVRLLGRLTPLQIPVSGYMLHPVSVSSIRGRCFAATSGRSRACSKCRCRSFGNRMS